MQKSYPIAQVSSPIEVLRRAGYSYFQDPQSGEESFVLRLGSEFYPRFHLYVESNQTTITLNLHLDQKKPSYGKQTMHSGEYDGATVENEMRRIDGWVKAMSREAQRDTSEHDVVVRVQDRERERGQNLRKWWKKLFG